MATLQGFLDGIWDEVGAECRGHVRETMRLIDRAGPEERPKMLAAFYWANWCRGRKDGAEGREKFWDRF